VIGFISVLSLYLSQSALYAMQILSVRPSVGLFVCHTRDLCKNGWTISPNVLPPSRSLRHHGSTITV